MFYYKPDRFFHFGMNNDILLKKNEEVILILELYNIVV